MAWLLLFSGVTRRRGGENDRYTDKDKKSVSQGVEETVSDVLTRSRTVINPKKNGRVRIKSPVCGCIELSRDMVISFHEGINDSQGPGGFVIIGLKRFSPFLVLVSEKRPHTSYPIIDPENIIPDYRKAVPAGELSGIGNPERDSMQVVTIVKLDGLRRAAFLDLRHPLLINVKGRVGKQIEVNTYPDEFEIPIALLRQ